MFRFFTTGKWLIWSWGGSAVILVSIWISVQISVAINEWFGEFYDGIQLALSAPNAITMEEYTGSLLSFGKLAAVAVVVGLVITFFTAHWLFRWRTSMVNWYHSQYDKARHIKGASQRVQEDTIRFSRILESLGTAFIESIMTLFEFMPILLGLSVGIPIMFFGDWSYGLVTGATIWAVGGTIFLIILARLLRLVGIEYDLQDGEAAYRKILVIAEDDGTIRPKTLDELYAGVREIHYKSYLRYLFFNVGRITYLQVNVLTAYIFLAPAIVAAAMTLGVMQQIIRAFGQVEGSLQFFYRSWPTVIELASVYKRLREFEKQIKESE